MTPLITVIMLPLKGKVLVSNSDIAVIERNSVRKEKSFSTFRKH